MPSRSTRRVNGRISFSQACVALPVSVEHILAPFPQWWTLSILTIVNNIVKDIGKYFLDKSVISVSLVVSEKACLIMC